MLNDVVPGVWIGVVVTVIVAVAVAVAVVVELGTVGIVHDTLAEVTLIAPESVDAGS